jgi:hypothetical protein
MLWINNFILKYATHSCDKNGFGYIKIIQFKLHYAQVKLSKINVLIVQRESLLILITLAFGL